MDWLAGLSEPRREAFHQLAATTNMPRMDLARALTAHGVMEARFPGSTAGQAMPNYADVHGFYSQLPPEYQNALRDFQGWQMQAIAEGPGRTSGQLVRGRDFRPQNWILHPDANVGDPNQLHNPDRYENMRSLADLHGIDVTNPAFQTYWRQQQQRWSDPAQRPAGGIPQLLEMYRGQNVAQRERQRATTDNTMAADVQRLFGRRQTDPATNQEVIVENPRGREPLNLMGHLGGIGRTVGSGFMALPAIGHDIGSSLETGTLDTSASRMAGRSFLDYPNQLLGTDIGHDVESRPLRFRQGQPYENVDIGPDAGRGLFGSRVVPTANGAAVQHGAGPAFGEAFRQQRLDPATGRLGRLGYGIAEHLADNAETYAGLAGGTGALRGVAGATAARAPLVSGVARGGAATTGFLQRLHNPVVGAAGQAARAIPTGADSNVGNWLDDVANKATLDDNQPGATQPQRLWASARRNFANMVPGAPAFAGDLRRPGGVRGIGANFGAGVGVGMGMDMAFPAPPLAPAAQTALRSTLGTSESERLRREREQQMR